MKCLVICQPYASLIIAGIKPVENRPWRTNYRGPLAILAGKSKELINELYEWDDPAAKWKAKSFQRLLKCEIFHDLPFGTIIGTVELNEIYSEQYYSHRFGYNQWASGPECWCLRNPRKLTEPIPYRGQQGLFNMSDELFDGKEWIKP